MTGVYLHELMNKPSSHLAVDDLHQLGTRVRRELAASARGVVIVQGANIIEDKAFVLDLLVHGNTPAVVTGAMSAFQVPCADGLVNLTATIRIAASRDSRDLGGLVVMNDAIHSAHNVTKRQSSSLATSTPDPGADGTNCRGAPAGTFSARLLPHIRFSLGRRSCFFRPRVTHASAEIGDDGPLIKAALDIG